MNDRPKISVIVPVYNVESMLERCIDSILDQSYRDFELLLIDDGSSDKSGDICDFYEKKDMRIRTFHKENTGVSATRNLGLKKAKGDYLVFIDSDDWVDRDFFQKISYSFDQYDIIFFGLQCLSAEGKVIDFYQPRNENTTESPLSQIVYSLFSIGLLGYMCSMVVKRSIILHNQIFFREDISIHEDSIFCYSCLKFAKTVVALDYKPYMYVVYTTERETLSSKTPSNYYEIALERIRIMKEMQLAISMPDWQRGNIIDCMKRWTYQRCMDWAFMQSNRSESIQSLFIHLHTIEDFKMQRSVKGLIFKLAIKLKSPCIMIFGKKLARIL